MATPPDVTLTIAHHSEGFLNAEFVSAICGAVLGGLFVLAASLFAEWLARGREKASRAEQLLSRQKAVANVLNLRIARAHAVLAGYRTYLEDAYAKAEPEEVANPISFVLPLIAAALPLRFTDEEYEVVTNIAGFEALQKLDLFENAYLTYAEGFPKYAEIRREFYLSKLPSNMTGNSGTFLFTEGDKLKYGFIISEANLLIEALRANLPKDIDNALQLHDLINNAFKKHFGNDSSKAVGPQIKPVGPSS